MDVPEASVMLVEHAERFGLAQLHQLRGRVGRGARSSRCYLVDGSAGGEGAAKLRTLERFNSGLQVAEEDLQLRCGPHRAQGPSLFYCLGLHLGVRRGEEMRGAGEGGKKHREQGRESCDATIM